LRSVQLAALSGAGALARAEAPASASGSGTRRPARARGTAPPRRCQSDYLSQAESHLLLIERLPLLARRGRPAHLVDLVEVDLAAFVHGLIGKNHRHRIGHADFQIGLGRLTVAAAIEEALQLRVHGITLLFLH